MSSYTVTDSPIPASYAHAIDSLRRLTSLGDAAAPLPSAPCSGAADAPAPAAAPATAPAADDGAAAAAAAARLEAKVRDVTELNDRIMAQNIALMSDLEAAQRAVRELRAGKDALARQLKRALLAEEARAGAAF